MFSCRLAAQCTLHTPQCTLDVEVQALLLQFILISAQNFAEDSVESGQQAAALLHHLMLSRAQIKSGNFKI